VHELYILARAVLLDALEALGAHRDAIVLVGAQAVYLHVGDADLAVRPYTTDADLLLDPDRLGEIPPLEQALMAAGFVPKKADSVGVWITHRVSEQNPKTEVCVDLLAPASLSPGRGRRAAHLKGHDARSARKVVGLEGSLVDVVTMKVRSLSNDDERAFDTRVAGPAALMVAKLVKIDDRRETGRGNDKDALDIVRLLRGVPTAELAERMRRLEASQISSAVADRAVDLLRALFGRHGAHGIAMAARAAGDAVDADELAASAAVLANDLLESLE
jgi:hypothetical protein